MKSYKFLCMAILLFGFAFTPSCASIPLSKKTQLEVFLTGVKYAAEVLAEQNRKTIESFEKSEERRDDFFETEYFDFSSSAAKRFVKQWQVVEKDVVNLRGDFNILVEKSDYLFSYAEYKSNLINDQERRQDVQANIYNKKLDFIQSIGDTNSVISNLESAVIEGNDIIYQLEIENALANIDYQKQSLKEIQDKAKIDLVKIEFMLAQATQIINQNLIN